MDSKTQQCGIQSKLDNDLNNPATIMGGNAIICVSSVNGTDLSLLNSCVCVICIICYFIPTYETLN